ncbi:histidine phosphatase family protein [Limnobaculum parvum]|uniref:Histidine phosphatase family protein n=1 Tax=Limnobaculum parvum TaxID=2172103 RepID=A0A2Y9U1H8_9GAMM|nr:histidine phosphatase family protein [Limnobaculum parvum]AWH89449.1 histidine phosphatase family protein [Limnobaculum parvum]
MILRNQYYVLRHGHSLANQKKIIVSDIQHGQHAYGLSPVGINQVIQTLENWPYPIPDLIFHSDFKRAAETAGIVADYFNRQAKPTTALRERHFGEFELQDDGHYPLVWKQDEKNLTDSFAQVEQLSAVCEREMALIHTLEQQHSQKKILLVGHGDPLQILLTHFQQKPLSQHRDLTPLMTAEVRKLNGELQSQAELSNA